MRSFIILLVVSCTLATPRIRRQTEGANWWDNLDVGAVKPDAINITELVAVLSDPKSGLDPNNFNTHEAFGNEVDADPRNSECEGPGTVCVPYYQCGDGKVNTDGTGLIDIRAGSKCMRYLDVCCKTPGQPPVTPKPADYSSSCGHRNDKGIHLRIAGLDNAQTQFGEYPWMVVVTRIETIGEKEANLFLCGGSLIQPNIVLTAAHCVSTYGATNLKIRAGEWDTQSTYELYPHQDRKVKHVIIHPDFNSGSLKNDYAVLILESAFVLAPNVDTVCLPEQGTSFDYGDCKATGWGKDKFGKDGRFQNILKQVSLKLVPSTTCEQSLQSTRLGKYFKLDSSFLCAGGEPNVDTCKGDGGSPLVCAKPSNGGDFNYYQVGIVAWGIGCGEEGVPGVYADVAKGVNWIKSVIIPYPAA